MNQEMFMEFLAGEGGLQDKFVKAMELSHRNLTLGQWLNWSDPDGYIADAFPWGETKDGQDFWEKVCDQWDGVLELGSILTGEDVATSDTFMSRLTYASGRKVY